MTYTRTFAIDFDPIADTQAVVTVPGARFTVLSPRLLRLEFSPDGAFEDRLSQAFWYRRQPVPYFEVRHDEARIRGGIEIETDYLLLRYQIGDSGFTERTLSITLKERATAWHYGQEDPLNLLGTARTLDDVDGALVLEEGLMSRQGWAVYDDSSSLVFDNDGWLEPRGAAEAYCDLYFFGFGEDFQACLNDFAAVAGAAPMVPRWALGNWWSRYWAYTDEELLGLMDEFRAHDVPLSFCIVDMDWHITEPGNACSGWTGYTWNRQLFPDPPAFINELHRRGLKTALNLHPAEGVHPHEAQYPAMAEHLGLDPQGKAPIPFDIANPQYTQAYFELLHHPHEADAGAYASGVDFWWIDWQQGSDSGLAGLDPLWWLNHLHFFDLGRSRSASGSGQKRPFIFSRWGGLGNHRYPIGFSGDTHVTWESLAFQPYFTATAANVNYGWWSHDIGGHMGGIEEAELFVRWVQFGVFSPIFRLHCTNNAFHERRPWGYDKQTEAVTAEAMRLRHALIPYIYTMAWRNHAENRPLVRPMYHEHPAEEAAYHCPDQYWFGSELVVAPFLVPAGESTRLSRQRAWLPEGDWFDFFNSERYPGDERYALYGRLQDIPVFAKAGAIVPLAMPDSWSGTDNPQAFTVHLFPGCDNEFLLYEDDGLSTSCITPIRQAWSAQAWRVTVAAAEGVCDFLADKRLFELHFRGIAAETTVMATLDGDSVPLTAVYDQERATLKVTLPAKGTGQTLAVHVSAGGDSLQLQGDYRLPACRRLVREFRMDTLEKQRLDRDLPAIIEEPRLLSGYKPALSAEQIRALAEVCGEKRN